MAAVCVFHYQWPPVQSTPEKDGHGPENRATGQSIIPSSLKHIRTHISSQTFASTPQTTPHTLMRWPPDDWICPLTPQDPKKGRHPRRCHGNTAMAGRVSWTMVLVMPSTQWEEHCTRNHQLPVPSPFKVCPAFTQLSFSSLLSTLRKCIVRNLMRCVCRNVPVFFVV